MTVIGTGKDGRPQERRARKDGWTKARRAAFLDQLEASCNIGRSCADAGMTYDGLRRLRKRDAAFEALVQEALTAGYERLESDLLARALDAGGQENPGDDDRRQRVVPMDDATKLRILQARRADRFGERSTQQSRRSDAEITASLLRKLEALAARGSRN